MLNALLQGLKQPEYVHVLINPLPIYGLAMGLLVLVVALALKSREARVAAFAAIIVAAASAWPVFYFGEQGYDRVKAMSDVTGEQWLGEHKRRGEQLIYVFYALAAVAVASVIAEFKWPKAGVPLAFATLLLGTATFGVGGYIAYPGGHVRHKEFRFEPPPEEPAESHEEH